MKAREMFSDPVNGMREVRARLDAGASVIPAEWARFLLWRITELQDESGAPVPSGEVETPPSTFPNPRAGDDRPTRSIPANGGSTTDYLVPAGEVETPCATCGDSKEVLRTVATDDEEFYPCPDCGVETPEAAVEAVAQALYYLRFPPRGGCPLWVDVPE